MEKIKYYKLLDTNELVIEDLEKAEKVFFNGLTNELNYKRVSLVPYYLIDTDKYDLIEELSYKNYLVELAKKIVLIKFEGKTDKAGKPYIHHLEFVGDLALEKSGLLEAKIVGYLHDLIEDTDVTVSQLEELFPSNIVNAVLLLTKNKQTKYTEYIKAIKLNELAKAVKLADLTHNSDLTRLKEITETDKARQEKYLKAIEYLNR